MTPARGMVTVAAPGAAPTDTAAVALERARALVLRHGWNATAYQILNPGIALWFSRAGDAAVGFVRYHHRRVVAGAPVCAEERLTGVAAEFEEDARAAGDAVCYFGAGTRLESRFRAPPLRRPMVLLGAQPVWDPSGWPAIVAGHASLRAQLNRARNKDVRVVEWPAARATGSAELRRVLAEWLGTRGLPPLHFMVEPDTLARLFDRRVFVALRDEMVIGFLIASPVPQRTGWLVEQIIRGRSAPNGTNELMIDAAMRTLAAAGSAYVTLGLSPLSRRAALPAVEHPLWLRLLLAGVRAHGRRFYNFEGLDAFKAKLRPERWEPIYAITSERHFTPGTLYAIASAFSAGSPVALVGRAVANAVWQEVRWLLGRARGK
jgi:phosphatidylglycerol lysyltransferase